MAFIIKQGDTSPAMVAALKTPDRQPVDLTGATVEFHMRFVPTDETPSATPVSAAAQIVDASAGEVRYAWGPTDTAVAGDWDAEFQVTFPGGAIETYPNNGYIEVSIIEQAG